MDRIIKNIKKKLLPLLLISAIISAMLPGMTVTAAASVWDGASASASLSGSGTSADPYQINSAADLAYLVNARFSSGKYYSLNTDIDLNGHQWTPIDQFYGKLNGNNHTISGLAIGTADTPSTGRELGLFRYTSNSAVIENLNVSDIAIYCAYTGTIQAYIGGIVAQGTSSTISNCSIDGAITVDSVDVSFTGGVIGFVNPSVRISGCNSSCDITFTGSGQHDAGGIAGWMQSTSTENRCYVDNCSSDGTLTGSKENTNNYATLGGLVGYITGVEISNSHSSSTVAGNETLVVGGLVGRVASSSDHNTISGCYASGNVSSSFYNSTNYEKNVSAMTCVGGLIGFNGAADVTNCYATGDVTGTDIYTLAGGFVGIVTNGGGTDTYTNTLKNCSAWGNVTCTANYSYAGGFSGCVRDYTIIENCFSRGRVIAAYPGMTYSGGFIGNFYSTNGQISITNCYASGKFELGYQRGFVGLFAKGDGSTITNSYYNASINNATTSSGTGLTTEVMRADASTSGALVNLLNTQAAAHSGDNWQTWTVKNSGYPIFGTGANQTAVPTGLGTVPVTSETASDGQITNTSADMEYRLSTEADWVKAAGSTVTGLAKGTYYVRYSDKTGYYPGPSVQVEVGVCGVSAWISPADPTVNGTNVTKTLEDEEITIDVTVGTGNSWALYSDPSCSSEITDKHMNLALGLNTAYLKVTNGSDYIIYTLTITRVLSSACDIVTWISPANPAAGATVTDAVYTVGNDVESLPVDVAVSPKAAWALYSDTGCSTEIADKVMQLGVGDNKAYLKVTAENGTTTKTYTLTITKIGSGDCDVTNWISPANPVISGMNITKNVFNSTTSLTVDVEVSPYAAWALYSDAGCTSVITDKIMNLNAGENTAYLKVTAQSGSAAKTYTITVKRSYFDAGTGEEDDPYIIMNLEQLKAVSKEPDAWYLLGADITGLDAPVCSEANPFTGHLGGVWSGTRHKVTLSMLDTTNTYIGLFGYIGSGGTVEDLDADGMLIGTRPSVHIGYIAGYNAGNVINCHSNASVSGSGGSNSLNEISLGGLVGYNIGSIEDSSSEGTVSGELTGAAGSKGRFGGIVGYNSGTITGSSSGVDISAELSSFREACAGGLAGYNSGDIADSRVTGEVSGSLTAGGSAIARLGGITGYHAAGTISGCYVSGDITGTSDAVLYVGGLAGQVSPDDKSTSGTVSYSYNAGAVTGNNTAGASTHIGGLVGHFPDGMIENCYNTGSVSGISGNETFVGGLVGYNGSGKTSCSYSAGEGTVTGGSQAYLGGLYGVFNAGSADNCYWDSDSNTAAYGDAYNSTDSVGTKLTTAEMTGTAAVTSMAGFDFTTVSDYVYKSNDAAYYYYPQLNIFAGSTDETVKAASLASVTKAADPTYAIVPINNQTLIKLTEGYASGTQETRSITITKTGTGDLDNLAVELGGADPGAFTITQPMEKTLNAETPSTTFKVKAIDGLAAGQYIATVTVAADSMTPATFSVTQTVSEPTVSATISPYECSFDLISPADIVTTITWNSAKTVTEVVYGEGTQLDKIYYSVDVNKLTIGQAFLSGLNLTEGASIDFVISFDVGDSAVLTVEAVKNYMPGSDASLDKLTVGGSEVDGFAADKYEYYVKLPYGTLPGSNSAQVGAEPSDPKATVSISQAVTLPGEAAVKVTAEDKATMRTYTVHFTIKSSNNDSDKDKRSDRDNDSDNAGSSHSVSYYAEVSGVRETVITVPAYVSGNGNEAWVDMGTLAAGVFSSNETPVVAMPSIPGVDNYTIKIPNDLLSGSQGKERLIFKTSMGSIIMPDNMLSGFSGEKSNEAEITIGRGDKSGLSDQVKRAIGDHPLVQLTLMLDGKHTEWNNPNAPVTVSIPYTPTASEMENPEAIVIWYVDGSGNAVSVPNGHYDPTTGTVIFATTHFSYYAAGYNKISFNDVAAGAWYSKAVGFIAARGITTGTGNGNFSPDAKLTRGDFLVMIMRAYEIAPAENPQDNFADAGSTYYTGYLAAAKRLGISRGVGSNMFAPGKEITRQEMFTLLYNILKVIGRLPQGNSGKTLSDFTDAGQIDSWAKDAVTLLVKTGTIGGNAGKLTPTSTTSRAEMAQVLYNLLANSKC